MTDRKVKRLTPNSIANLVMADEAWHDSLYVRAEDYDSLLADFEHLRTHLAAEQPKQEPVAWRPRLSPNIAMHWNRPWNDGVPSAQTADYWNRSGQGVEYAYAAPPEDEALRRDAERYRWLRTNCYSDKYPYSEFDSAMQLSFTVSGIWANNRDPAVLDGCLDTAMGDKT